MTIEAAMCNHWVGQPPKQTWPRAFSPLHSPLCDWFLHEDILKPQLAKSICLALIQEMVIKHHHISQFQGWPHRCVQDLATLGHQYHGPQVAHQQMATKSRLCWSHVQGGILQHDTKLLKE
jgi:hypothetical protein